MPWSQLESFVFVTIHNCAINLLYSIVHIFSIRSFNSVIDEIYHYSTADLHKNPIRFVSTVKLHICLYLLDSQPASQRVCVMYLFEKQSASLNQKSVIIVVHCLIRSIASVHRHVCAKQSNCTRNAKRSITHEIENQHQRERERVNEFISIGYSKLRRW